MGCPIESNEVLHKPSNNMLWKFLNVKYIPNLITNLIFIRQFNSKVYDMIFIIEFEDY